MSDYPKLKCFSALSNIGLLRSVNEDRYLLKECNDGSLLMAVADGLGGLMAGDVAAQIVVDTLDELDCGGERPLHALAKLVLKANGQVMLTAKEHWAAKEMGSTVIAIFIRQGVGHWVNVGDSRLYLFRDGKLKQLSTDQNLAQQLWEDHILTGVEARRHPLSSILDQCVGGGALDLETGELAIESGDTLFLCTDGLYGDLDPGIKTEILSTSQSLDKKLEKMIMEALEVGGRDNITVVAAEF
jgi:serine/threonine protein phosphatase PrpC